MDRNGYNPSIFDTEPGECWLCRNEGQTVRHEVFGGNPNRRLSKYHGLWIDICPSCHNKVHASPKEYEWLKEAAQALYEYNHTRQEWVSIIGRNYRDE